MNRLAVGLAGVGVAALVAMPATAASGANVPLMHWGASSVTVILPAGADTWTLSVDEPNNGNTIIGVTALASGATFTQAVPAFCGTVQADLYKNGRYDFGRQQVFNTCVPTPPTTQPPPTTTVPPVTTSPPSTVPPLTPVGGGSGGGSPGTGTGGPTNVSTGSGGGGPANVSTGAGSGGASVAATPATPQTETLTGAPQLAYTGINWAPLALMGSALSGLGLLLIRRRRTS